MTKFPPISKARRLNFDWAFVRKTSTSSVGLAVGRVFGFAFSLLAARHFTDADFGSLSYLLVVGTGLLTIAIKPLLQTVLPYFIGTLRDDEVALREILESYWPISLVVTTLSGLVGSIVLIILDQFEPAVLVVYLGTVVFYSYWGLSTGYLASGRFTLFYLASNFVQILLVVIVLIGFDRQNISDLLIVYGLAYIPPLLVLQRYWPLKLDIGFRPKRPQVMKLLTYAMPIWLSHGLFQIQSSAGVLFLESFATREEIGVFSLTATVVQVFALIPEGISLILMPMLAGMTGDRKRYVALSIVVSIVFNLIALAIYLPAYRWFIESFVGEQYFHSLTFGAVMAVNAIIAGVYAIVTQGFIGVGKPKYSTVGRVVIVIVVLIGGFQLVPSMGVTGAALTKTFGLLAGLVAYGILALRLRKRGGLDGPPAETANTPTAAASAAGTVETI